MFEYLDDKYYYTGDTNDINFIKNLNEDSAVKRIYCEVRSKASMEHIYYNDIESPKDAAIREMYEEIGITISNSELKLLDTFLFKKSDNSEFINHLTYLFLVGKDVDLNSIPFDTWY